MRDNVDKMKLYVVGLYILWQQHQIPTADLELSVGTVMRLLWPAKGTSENADFMTLASESIENAYISIECSSNYIYKLKPYNEICKPF